MKPKAQLWQCPRCGERFTTRNQYHSCGKFSLDALFAGSEPHVRELFDRFRAMVEEIGPVTVVPQRTRIAFQVRMRFAALMPQKRALRGHLVLERRSESRFFEKIETYSPRNHVHVFVFRTEEDLTPAFRPWIVMAYRVGCQEHLSQVDD